MTQRHYRDPALAAPATLLGQGAAGTALPPGLQALEDTALLLSRGFLRENREALR